MSTIVEAFDRSLRGRVAIKKLEVLVIAPPCIVETSHIDPRVNTLAEVSRAYA